jgi:glycopeptide antibiotics resistance protein
VVAFGVFGPSPGNQIQQAGHGVRQAADEIALPVPWRSPSDGPGRRPEVPVLGLLTEAVANVAMFVFWGVLFPVVLPRRRWWAVPAGAALSAMIELIQLLFLSWRSPSLNDIGWNTFGAILGFILWLAASAMWQRRPSARI